MILPSLRSSSHALSFSSFTARAHHVGIFFLLTLLIFLAFSVPSIFTPPPPLSSSRFSLSSSTHVLFPTVRMVSGLGFKKKEDIKPLHIPVSVEEPPPVQADNVPVPPSSSSSFTSSSDSLLPLLVEEWNVSHVYTWMKEVAKCSECLSLMEEYRLDGITLLELPLDNLFEYFPSMAPLHRIKWRAHLRQLHNQNHAAKQEKECLCGNERKEWEEWKVTCGPDVRASREEREWWRKKQEANSWSLWQQLADHSRRTLMLGSSVALFPRFTLLAAYYVYPEVYEGFIGKRSHEEEIAVLPGIEDAPKERMAAGKVADQMPSPSSPSNGISSSILFFRKVLFWTALVMTPYMYLGIYALWFIRSSYLVMPVVTGYFFLLATADIQIMCALYRNFSWSALWKGMPEWMFLFLIAVIVSFVFSFLPWWLGAIWVLVCVALMALFCLSVFAEELHDWIKRKESQNKTEAEGEGKESATTPPSADSPPSADAGTGNSDDHKTEGKKDK